jgi:formylglycine-generating enzyme required for sulfatase activity
VHDHLLIPALVSMVMLAGTAVPATAMAGEDAVLVRDRFVDGSGRSGPPLVRLPAARFVMGSAPRELGYAPREPRHAVQVTAFAIGQHEVTNAEFCELLNAEGNVVERGAAWLRLEPDVVRIRQEGARFVAEPGYERHPVTGVTWMGARAYCRWLTKQTGRQYRLPTEAEWEYAARAGAGTAWPWGDRFDGARLNWRRTREPASTLAVGSFPANAWGVHDMLGNVWEWVLDAFSEYFYLYAPLRDPVNFDPNTRAPVIRGGSFRNSLEYCRPGFRVNYPWQGDGQSIGFRVSRHG